MPPSHAVHHGSNLDPPCSLSQRIAADRLPPLECRCGPSPTSLPWHSAVDCALPFLPLVPRDGIQGRARPFTAATPLSPFSTANQGRAPLPPAHASGPMQSPAPPSRRAVTLFYTGGIGLLHPPDSTIPFCSPPPPKAVHHCHQFPFNTTGAISRVNDAPVYPTRSFNRDYHLSNTDGK